jgi:uncharacterized circularly permuted ATP-grasp superfamily protein
MNKYSDGKIYKLIDNEGRTYIGSTTLSLHTRFDLHIEHSKTGKSKIQKALNINKESFKIELIETYPCESKLLLRQREQYWINELLPTLNKNRAYRSIEQLTTDRRNNFNRYIKNNYEYRKNYLRKNYIEKHLIIPRYLFK